MPFLSDDQRKAAFARLACARGASGRAAAHFYNEKPFKSARDRVVIEDGRPVLYLYQTPIARMTAQGTVETRTNGHRTNTTKERLNCVISPSGHSIFMKKGQWYFKDAEGHVSEYHDGEQFPISTPIPKEARERPEWDKMQQFPKDNDTKFTVSQYKQWQKESPNFMTPQLVAFKKRDNEIIELSKGEDFEHQPMYGVTSIHKTPKGFKTNKTDVNKSFTGENAKNDAQTYYDDMVRFGSDSNKVKMFRPSNSVPMPKKRLYQQ